MIGIGVIGCGSMGRSILRRVLRLDEQLRVAAIFDPDEGSIEKAVGELPARPRLCADYRELVALPEVDWVMIASWNSFHCDQAVAALEAGKHVFCQKPLALTIEDCLRMHRAWKESGKLFNIGFTLRYSPHYRKIRQLLEEGAIGGIVSMEFNETLDFNHGGYIMGDWRRLRKNAGTHLLEKCCHDIDLVNWMVGALPRRVASFGGLNFFTPGNERHIARLGKNDSGRDAYRTWKSRVGLNPFTSDKDIADNQVVIMEFENDVRATFHTNCNAGIPERRMYILGAEGAIRADVLTGEIQLRRIGFETVPLDASTTAKGGHGGGDDTLSKELVESMLHNAPPRVGLVEGMAAAITGFAIDEAMDTGKVVDLAPWWEKVDQAISHVS